MPKKSVTTTAAAPVAQVARELPPGQQVPRLDICIIFDARNCNPNGDPDRGNAPRRNPTNGHGMTSDVSLKRKLRDRVEDRFAGEPGLNVFVTRGSVLSDIKKRVMADKADPTLAMCEEFWDVRTFGAVLAANQDAAARATNVRGPVQVSMAESVEPVIVSEPAITRCAAENEREKDGMKRLNQTFGSKQLVHYGLYRAHVFVDPIRAKKTGFSMEDLEILKDALANMFEGDRAAARTGLCVRAIYAFEHKSPLGTPGANGLELLEQIRIERISEGPGQSFEDYRISLPGGLPEGLTLTTWKEPLSLPRLAAAE